VKKCAKKVILEKSKFKGTLPFFQAQIRFSRITLFSCILSLRQVYIFDTTQKDEHFDT
jgi:hypothetical protein